MMEKNHAAFDIFYTALKIVKKKLPNDEKTALEIWKNSSR